MMVLCEVKGCKEYPEHDLEVGKVRIRICTNHRKAARKIAKKYAMRMLEAVIDIQDEFMSAIIDIKEEE